MRNLMEYSDFSSRTSSEQTASNCRTTECAIVDYNLDDTVFDTKWVSVYGIRNHIDNSYFNGKTNHGTKLVEWLNGDSSEYRMDHNYFGPHPDRDKNGAESIRFGMSSWCLTVHRSQAECTSQYYKHSDQ